MENIKIHITPSDRELLQKSLSNDAISSLEAIASLLNQYSTIEQVNIVGFFAGTLKAVLYKEAVQGIIDVWDSKISEDLKQYTQ